MQREVELLEVSRELNCDLQGLMMSEGTAEERNQCRWFTRKFVLYFVICFAFLQVGAAAAASVVNKGKLLIDTYNFN